MNALLGTYNIYLGPPSGGRGHYLYYVQVNTDFGREVIHPKTNQLF